MLAGVTLWTHQLLNYVPYKLLYHSVHGVALLVRNAKWCEAKK